ncbi:putative Dethiobiotin synthase [Prochlorococcus marinus str. NATL1A]|uniref:ATP-dependent dethiobiotin synthetase BioD n=1 Tax=Prochlorococcus marinus (strain NATL1A) TaxID=167555 RepID=A2C4L7_PROM1|nr:dethiobiotin synthase [Prochlorococcus marinus]ABM76427.1 putative Dethiobiotin synthase [Prochlorococcus marinus str. NATL1A]
MSTFSKRIIICGTDTDVGKTIVSSFLVQGLKGIYWKPIQSGTEEGTDTKTVCNLLSLEPNSYLPERYKFKAPVSPHWAAEQESAFIEPSNLKLPDLDKLIIIETAGGLMVPLNRDWLQIDQLKAWGAPIILVARTGLGTLNHTLLSLEALKNRNLDVLGIVLNGPPHKDNPKTLEQFGDTKILASLPIFDEVNAKVLSQEWHKQQLDQKLKRYIQN